MSTESLDRNLPQFSLDRMKTIVSGNILNLKTMILEIFLDVFFQMTIISSA